MNTLKFIDQFIPQILDGSKTMTRRLLKPQPTHFYPAGVPRRVGLEGGSSDVIRCPFGQPGDKLWVPEAWRHTAHTLAEARAITEDIMSGTAVAYRADDPEPDWETWRPANTMPRWASRILLEITDVRVERLFDISEDDARAEGVKAIPDTGGDAGPNLFSSRTDGGWLNSPTAAGAFGMLWEFLYGEGSWDANSFVWVIAFKRLTP